MDRMLQIMIISKPKSHLAYAKICRDKSAPSLPTTSPTSPISNTFAKENLYDELIHDLEPDQSCYIKKLINKQERKSLNKDEQSLPPSPKHILHDRSNRTIDPSFHQQSLQPSRKPPKSKEIVEFHQKEPSSGRKRKSHKVGGLKETVEIGTRGTQKVPITVKSAENSGFLQNLADYMTSLRNHSHRRTEQTSTKEGLSQNIYGSGNSQYWQVNPHQYKDMLNELQEVVACNDQLEQKLEQQEQKVQEMKSIIRLMWCEISTLRKDLKSEQKQKEKYQLTFEQVIAKMEVLRAKSKGHAAKRHKQRYSHIPSSSQIEEDIFTKKGRPKHYFEDRKTCDFSQLAKFSGDLGGLKKKGKQFKAKKQHFQQQYDAQSPAMNRCFYESYS